MIFESRYSAGVKLAKAKKLQKLKGKENVIVLGIPRGGMVVAKAVSEKLILPLSFVVTKKIGAPNQSELAVGAVAPEGVVVLDVELISSLKVSAIYIEKVADKKTDEIAARIIMYNGKNKTKIKGKTVILVDDGIATGATVEVAIKYLKTKKVKDIILAAPVAPGSVVSKFQELADDFVVLHAPENFSAVGQFYKNFPQVSDEEVVKLLA